MPSRSFSVAAVGPHEDPRDLTYFLDVIVTAALLMDRNAVQKCYDQAAAMAESGGFGSVAERIRKYPSIFWNHQDRPGGSIGCDGNFAAAVDSPVTLVRHFLAQRRLAIEQRR